MFDKQFKYKDCQVTSIEQENNIVIRLHNKFGFRWFKTPEPKNYYLKVKEAYRIEQEIINGKSKHGYQTVEL